ncbi:MAG TPA: hypothetical protein DD729_10825 [Rhodobacteraceae bacterium]|nr:hypothetical protein [Paracoccaceae bacterium]
MLILPGPLPVAPPPDQALMATHAPSQINTVTAVASTSKARNETGTQTGPHNGEQPMKKAKAFPNPDQPTGPPPTFEANLLETELEKLRAGPEIAHKKATPEEAQPQEQQYQNPPEAENHIVDITL